MRVREEFSRFAAEYGKYNVIQAEAARKLLADTSGIPRRILDLGCGNGTLFGALSYVPERFVGVDFSASMLSHHPLASCVELICGDFNDAALFERLSTERFDRIYSASALQWAHDLDRVFASIVALEAPVSLAIFTSGTFRSLYETAGLEPILKSVDEVMATARHRFDARFEIVRYEMEFETVRDMLRYIKRSGVSGGRRVLDVAQTKALMRDYPLNYLEFEVVFITS